jgi:hypothetical protein
VVHGGQERRELLASAIWVYRVRDFEQGRPGTRLVTRSKGSVLVATTLGKYGTVGSAASAVRTPISFARRSAAG